MIKAGSPSTIYIIKGIVKFDVKYNGLLITSEYNSYMQIILRDTNPHIVAWPGPTWLA